LTLILCYENKLLKVGYGGAWRIIFAQLLTSADGADDWTPDLCYVFRSSEFAFGMSSIPQIGIGN